MRSDDQKDADRPSLVSTGFAVAAVVAAAVTVRTVFLGAGRVPFDDAFIALRYAWNLIHHGGWYFNFPGENVQGASSLLWVLILSPLALFLRSGDPLSFPFLMLSGALLQIGAVVLLMLSWRSRRRFETLALAVLFAISPTLLDHAFGGMEVSLAAFFLALAYVSTPKSKLWCIALGLLAVTRPETSVTLVFLLVAIHVLPELKQRRYRETASTALWVAIPVAAVVALVVAMRGWRSPIPTTLAAKNATYDLLLGNPGLADRLLRTSALAGVAMSNVPLFVGPLLTILVGIAAAVLVAKAASRNQVAWVAGWVATLALQVLVIKWSFPWYTTVGGTVALVVIASALSRFTGRRPLAMLAVVAIGLVGIDLYKARTFSPSTLAGALEPLVGSGKRQDLSADNQKVGVEIANLGGKPHVLLEPAGIVGFVSGAIIDDSIGLISNRVPLSRDGKFCWFDQVVDRLQPDVIVLRQAEVLLNRDFINRYQTPLSCRGQPIPPGYFRLFPDNGPLAQSDRLVALARRNPAPAP
jgi:hypothetical protein